MTRDIAELPPDTYHTVHGVVSGALRDLAVGNRPEGEFDGAVDISEDEAAEAYETLFETPLAVGDESAPVERHIRNYQSEHILASGNQYELFEEVLDDFDDFDDKAE